MRRLASVSLDSLSRSAAICLSRSSGRVNLSPQRWVGPVPVADPEFRVRTRPTKDATDADYTIFHKELSDM